MNAVRSVMPSCSGMVSTVIPAPAAYVPTTAATAGLIVADMSTRRFLRAEATAMIMASAVAVAPSYIDALLTSSPVSSAIID